jgi:hypothetical protein
MDGWTQAIAFTWVEINILTTVQATDIVIPVQFLKLEIALTL